MKSKWFLLFACTVALSICLPQALAQDQTNATAASSLVVVDSAGRVVGSVVGVMQGTGITIAVIHGSLGWLPVYVQRSLFQTGSLEYATSDCSGQAYGSASASPLAISAVITTAGGNILYGEDGPDQIVNVNSFLDAQGNCDQSSYQDPDAVPMSSMMNLSTFVPPFKVTIIPRP